MDRVVDACVAFPRHLGAQVGEFDLGGHVQAFPGFVPEFQFQRPVVDVQLLHAEVGERHDLGQERVDPYERVECIFEVVLIIVVEGGESVLESPVVDTDADNSPEAVFQERLRQLDALHERRAITDTEYDQKRQQIIDEL